VDALPFLVVLRPFTQKVCTSESCSDKIVLLYLYFFFEIQLCVHGREILLSVAVVKSVFIGSSKLHLTCRVVRHVDL